MRNHGRSRIQQVPLETVKHLPAQLSSVKLLPCSLPSVHSVQFYDSDEALITRLCSLVCSGLLNGDSALIVATKQHRDQLVEALKRLEVDERRYKNENRLTLCDAEKTLAKFMIKGLPDPHLFLACVGKLVADARRVAGKQERGPVVFGEMVAVLWDQGNKAGALEVEELWNDLINEKAFHLHCAYPRALFLHDDVGMLNICENHSYIHGAVTQAV